MTVSSCKYHYEQSEGVLYKIYIGPVSFEFFVSTWKNAFETGEVPEGIKRYVIDYTSAHFKVKVSEYLKIAEFYKEHINYFRGARIAIVVSNPQDIVIPILVETKDDGYSSKTFTTLEAARKWAMK